jgi:ABC-type antimicrobial peptide transport system permease subunit
MQVHEVDNQNLITVVGVVRNLKSASLRGDNSRAVYLPLTSASHSLWNFRIEIWTEGSPESLIPSVRKAFAAENDQITVNLRNFTEIVDRRLLYERLLSIISVSFATLGLLMAAVGIYGVAAYTVSRRLLEVGIRRAIGASGLQIIWLFLREHILVAIAGAAVGVAASIELTPFLRTWLFGVSALDAPSFTASVVLLLAVSAIAVFIPASRSLRPEPSTLLRTDS